MRRALAIEMAHAALDRNVLELALPDGLHGDIRYLARGLSREEMLIVAGHLALMVRMFAAEVPVGRRDQMLTELDAFDTVLDARTAPRA
jgi:hypothetical protein